MSLCENAHQLITLKYKGKVKGFVKHPQVYPESRFWANFFNATLYYKSFTIVNYARKLRFSLQRTLKS